MRLCLTRLLPTCLSILVSSDCAFTNNIPFRDTSDTTTRGGRIVRQMSLEGGWDNDNFLDSLGKTTEDQDQANDDYYQMSRYGPPPEEVPSSTQQQQQNPNQQQELSNQNMNMNAGFQQQPPTASFSQTQQQNPPPMDAFAQLQQQQQQQILELQRQQQQQLQLLQQQQLQQLQMQQNVQAQQFGQQPSVQQPQQSGQLGQQPNVQQPPQFGQESNVQKPAQQFGQQPSFDDGANAGVAPPNPGEEDELPTQDIEGAVLTDEMRAKMKASHTQDEEESQGGQLFRNLMTRAKQKARQQQTVQPVAPTQISNVPIPDNAESLSVHEQARLFRDIMLQRQQEHLQQQQPTSYAQQQLPNYPYSEQNASPQFLPQGIGYDGRKIGRNKDSDAISTSADVYLAKLKRDSTTRRIARDSGDYDKANAIFHDPSIQEITAPVNPYLEDRRKREHDMLETVPEEMLIFQEYSEDADEDTRSYSGISFKEKLAQAKQRKLEQGGGGGGGSN